MRLSEIIGNAGVTRLLARLIARDRLPHALLIEGLPGCGRRTLAIALAQALLCPQAPYGEACGICPSCRLVDAGTHPDLTMLPHDSESDDLGVEVVRERVVEAAYASPLMGRRRVFVLPGVERLNLAAANALLKVLEEPPNGAFLVMTTAAAAGLLRTIRSRAQLHRLQPLTADEIERILVRSGIPPGDAKQRAMFGNGSHRGLWEGAPEVPLDDLLALCRSGYSARLVGALVALLPQRVSSDSGRTLPAEQRRVVLQWMQALIHRLRQDLRGAGSQAAADLIDRVLLLRQDILRNISPQLVIEGLGLPQR
jgi:DNA polymerase III delta' subunit